VIVDLTRLAILPLGDRLVAAAVQRNRVQTFVVEAETPAAALRAELDQRRISARGIAVGLPRTAVSVKPIELPSVDGDLADMVRFELERHVPYASEDTPFDFIPLPAETAGAAAARRVLLVAADRRAVDGALRIVEEARLRPVSVTVAAHNLLALVARPRRGRVVWVHRVGEGAELLFVARGTMVLSRALAEADDEALVEEIRRSFAVTRWRGCDAVWLSGDGDANVPGALLELGAPVMEPPFTAIARRRLAAVTESPRGAAELAVAVATAGRARPLELLPPALRPRHLTRGQLATAGLAAATVVLALGALLVPGYRESRRLGDVNARIARLDPEVKTVEAVMQELERKKRLVATIDSIQAGTVRPLPVLRELTDLLPNEAWLTMLTLDPKGVELTGQAAAAAALIPVLENSPRLERVEFSSPVTRGRDKEQFRIRATWEGGPGAVVATATPRPGGPPPGPVQRPFPGAPAGRPAPPPAPAQGTQAPGVPQVAAPPPAPQPGIPGVNVPAPDPTPTPITETPTPQPRRPIAPPPGAGR